MTLIDRLIQLRDNIRTMPMMHPADASAREDWGDELSAIIVDLLIQEENTRDHAPHD